MVVEVRGVGRQRQPTRVPMCMQERLPFINIYFMQNFVPEIHTFHPNSSLFQQNSQNFHEVMYSRFPLCGSRLHPNQTPSAGYRFLLRWGCRLHKGFQKYTSSFAGGILKFASPEVLKVPSIDIGPSCSIRKGTEKCTPCRRAHLSGLITLSLNKIV